MSQGKLTPLGANVLCALLDSKGLYINGPSANSYGVSNTIAQHTKGSIETDTVLGKVNDIIQAAYAKLGGTISKATYDKIIAIGNNSIPALGNSNPSTFENYNPIIVDSFINSSGQTYYKLHYAPSALVKGSVKIVTVKVNGVEVAASNYSITDNTLHYTGKLFPEDKIEVCSVEGTKYGFVHVISNQAMREFKYGNGTYPDFCNSVFTCQSYLSQSNSKINTLQNAIGFLDGTYSNMDDLITSDISGITLSMLHWGQELIKTGRAIDLSKLKTFGSPYNLLLTLRDNNSIINGVAEILLNSGFTTSNITELLEEKRQPTNKELKNLYTAFSHIKDNTLKDVLITLNVQTKNIESLADLLNPKKLFPNSYTSLTVPKFNIDRNPTNSKTYYLIYTKSGINNQLRQFKYGTELQGIVPTQIAEACGALRKSMLQVKHIEKISVEKFSQIVSNMETTKGLNNVNGTTTPNNSDALITALRKVAKGGGDKGTYQVTDFYGAMSGVGYMLDEVQGLIKQLQTTELSSAYTQLLTKIQSGTETEINQMVSQANNEIVKIKNSNPAISKNLNDLWNSIGKQLSIEIAARALALRDYTQGSVTDIYNFVDSIATWASETQPNMTAQVLEAISDTTIIGGQSIIGMMREERNSQRLGLGGGTLDNTIPDVPASVPIETPKTTPTIPVGNGETLPKVTGESQTPGSFGGSPETNLVPANLDIFNISTTTLPSIIDPPAAVEQVISCNCDCWDDLPN